MRVLVTGASGLIGSRVCAALLERGDEVVGLSRHPDAAREKSPGVRWFGWEATSERPPGEALEGVEGVVHLLGEPIDQRWTAAAKRRILETRTTGTRNLVDAIAALERRPRVLVSQAAIGYYGDRGDEPLDEAAPPGEGFDSRVVLEWERAAREAQRLALRLVVLRSGVVLEPRAGLLARMLPPFRLGVGGPLAGGGQYVSWIHIDDEVGIVLWALDSEEVSGTLNATAPNPVTNRELSKALGRVLRRPAVVPVPRLALVPMVGRELARTIAGGQRVLPRRALDLGYRFRFPELEPALRDLL